MKTLKISILITLFGVVMTCLTAQTPQIYLENQTYSIDRDSISVPIYYRGTDSLAPIAVQGVLIYDSAVLVPTSFQPEAAVSDWLTGYNIVEDSVYFALAGATQLLQDGAIGYMRFDVKATTPTTTTITLENLLANTTELPTTTGEITLQPLIGDVNADGVVNSTDAREILQEVIGAVQWSLAKQEVADYDGNGEVQSYDVGLILQSL